MKYRILKDFKGSQDGTLTESFVAGTDAELSDYLVACVDPSWIAPFKTVEINNKAIITDSPKRGRPAK